MPNDEKQLWPTCRYHPVHGSRLVHNEDDLAALGEGWQDTPFPAPPPPPPPPSEVEELQQKLADVTRERDELERMAQRLTETAAAGAKEIARLKAELKRKKPELKPDEKSE